MDDEIEDIIGEVKYTDSQKSVTATTHLPSTNYSPDFTDSSSDRHNSSGKDTYVIEFDSEDSEITFPLRDSKSVINLYDTASKRSVVNLSRTSTTKTLKSSFTPSMSIEAQETYTQTSKTIIQLAENDGAIIVKPVQNHTLETQTSLRSITDSQLSEKPGKTVVSPLSGRSHRAAEYRIEVSRTKNYVVENQLLAISNMCGDSLVQEQPTFMSIVCNRFATSFDDHSSKFPVSDTENEDNRSEASSNDRIINIIDDGSKENMLIENTDDDSRSRTTDHDFDSTPVSDMEEDSLMVSSNTVSSNKDVQELRDKLNRSADLCKERYGEPDSRRFGTLTPLTEESNHRRDSLMDITPLDNITVSESSKRDDVIFTNNAGMKVKLLKGEDFKLPPIHNQSCPNSPQLNSLFSNKLHQLCKAGTLPCLHERTRNGSVDRWETGNRSLAAGESTHIRARNASPKRNGTTLPPIHVESSAVSTDGPSPRTLSTNSTTLPDTKKSINIKDKIKELKMSTEKKTWLNATKYNSVSRADSRSRSPSPSNVSTDDQHRLSEVAERGCEALCVEMIRRMRSTSWFDVIETLEEIPKAMEKFWTVITEQRITDILRQMNGLIESPRPQVARAACTTVAVVLKNTSYTKKPDFFETMTVLLSKTGSYSRPLRRAANVALDEVVCALDHVPAATALCVHGVGHKNPLVRCAAARLLVVCCALAGGGRGLLRARPPTAAAARRHALRALAALLDDKSTDTRKYAERLYSILRPLKDFEAYYLTDVDVETASRHMKKYDQVLQCRPTKEDR